MVTSVRIPGEPETKNLVDIDVFVDATTTLNVSFAHIIRECPVMRATNLHK